MHNLIRQKYFVYRCECEGESAWPFKLIKIPLVLVITSLFELWSGGGYFDGISCGRYLTPIFTCNLCGDLCSQTWG